MNDLTTPEGITMEVQIQNRIIVQYGLLIASLEEEIVQLKERVHYLETGQ